MQTATFFQILSFKLKTRRMSVFLLRFGGEATILNNYQIITNIKHTLYKNRTSILYKSYVDFASDKNRRSK